MKLELKKISFSESLSEETNAFTADVYINGVLRAEAVNHGHGGNTDVRSYAKPRKSPEGDARQIAEMRANQAVMDQYDLWASEQPNTDIGKYDWRPEGFTRTLEGDVDDALETWLREVHYVKKEVARQKRLIKKHAVTVFTKKSAPGSYFTLPRPYTPSVRNKIMLDIGADLDEIFNDRFITENKAFGPTEAKVIQQRVKAAVVYEG